MKFTEALRRHLLCGVLLGIALLRLIPHSQAAESASGLGITSIPDSLILGTVAQDATLIAGVRVGIPDNSGAAGNPDIQLPPFLQLLDRRAETGPEGVDWILRLGTVTSRTGTFRGEIRLRAGLLSSRLPVELDVVPRDPSQSRLLVLDTPWTHFGFEEGTQIRPWLDVVRKSGVTADYLWLHEGQRHEPLPDLSPFSTVLVSGESLATLVEPEMVQLRTFATNGGRLLVFANRFFVGSVPGANRLLQPTGLRFSDREPTNRLRPDAEGFDRYIFRITGDQLHPHPMVEAVHSVHAFRPSPIHLTTNANLARPLVSLPGYTNAHLAVVTPLGRGEAVGVGLTLWATMTSEPGAEDSDNVRFLGRLLHHRRPSP